MGGGGGGGGGDISSGDETARFKLRELLLPVERRIEFLGGDEWRRSNLAFSTLSSDPRRECGTDTEADDVDN